MDMKGNDVTIDRDEFVITLQHILQNPDRDRRIHPVPHRLNDEGVDSVGPKFAVNHLCRAGVVIIIIGEIGHFLGVIDQHTIRTIVIGQIPVKVEIADRDGEILAVGLRGIIAVLGMRIVRGDEPEAVVSAIRLWRQRADVIEVDRACRLPLANGHHTLLIVQDVGDRGIRHISCMNLITHEIGIGFLAGLHQQPGVGLDLDHMTRLTVDGLGDNFQPAPGVLSLIALVKGIAVMALTITRIRRVAVDQTGFLIRNLDHEQRLVALEA